MKLLKKTLSVGLSLVMCAAMVSPAFAASFKDLQDAIDGTGGTQIGDTGRYGYAETTHEDGSKSYGIEAWQSDRTVNGEADGQTRYVKLNENVEYDAGKDEDNKTITIAGDEDAVKDVTLDLNGNDIDAKKETGTRVIKVEKTGALTLNDSSGNDSGKITGGKISTGGGGGVYNVGTFTMNGGTITGNESIGAPFKSGDSGGGVWNAGTFTMNGGAISGNEATNGGGVWNKAGGTFTMNGGTISDNKAIYGGGVHDAGMFTMNGGAITGNTVINNGGGIYVLLVAVKPAINGGAIWNNKQGEEDWTSDNVAGVTRKITWSNPAQRDCAHDEIVETTAEDGTKTYTCSACGMSYSESDTQGVWDKSDATCTAEGSVSYAAGAYRAAYSIPADPDNHVKTEVRGAEEATYDKEGYTGDTYCLDCGELIEKGEAIPRLTRPTDNNNPDDNNPGDDDKQPETPVTPPSGNGNENRPNPGVVTPPSGGGENNAPVTPAETEVIDEPDVPLAEAPADETEVIEDADVPLAELPEESAQEPAQAPAAELEVIEDGAVPLSDVPQTGEASTALWLAAVLIAGMGLVYVNTGKRRQNAR